MFSPFYKSRNKSPKRNNNRVVVNIPEKTEETRSILLECEIRNENKIIECINAFETSAYLPPDLRDILLSFAFKESKLKFYLSDFQLHELRLACTYSCSIQKYSIGSNISETGSALNCIHVIVRGVIGFEHKDKTLFLQVIFL